MPPGRRSASLGCLQLPRRLSRGLRQRWRPFQPADQDVAAGRREALSGGQQTPCRQNRMLSATLRSRPRCSVFGLNAKDGESESAAALRKTA